MAHGPSRSAACGILPDQGLNLCPLHWQADSQPLRHQGSPSTVILTILILPISDRGISLHLFVSSSVSFGSVCFQSIDL